MNLYIPDGRLSTKQAVIDAGREAIKAGSFGSPDQHEILILSSDIGDKETIEALRSLESEWENKVKQDADPPGDRGKE